MALRILKASEPIKVEHLNVCIYGAPGTGKSTLAFSSNKPILLDFDKGAHRAANRKDIVAITRWEDVEGLTSNDLKEYDTIIVDTVGRALDALALDICEKNPKHGIDGALKLQGFGELKSRFSKWLKLLNSFGKDVILIAHMDEQKNGDDIIERLDAQGSSKNEVYKSVDAMGRVNVSAQGRILDFNPTSASYGKNPGGLSPLKVPHIATEPNFMAEVISSIKDSLNEQTEEQRKAQAEIDVWNEKLSEISTVDGINDIVSKSADEAKPVKLLISKRAEALGYIFDKKNKKFIDATQADAVPA